MRKISLLQSFISFLMTMAQDDVPSACNNGRPGSSVYGYACPQMMLLSDPMIGAATYDGFSPREVLYGVAGSSTEEDCGKCYLVRLLDAEQQWRDDFPLLVLQIFNNGYDVMPFQFDVFMGGGGFGYFTACNSDCRERSCQGGPCFAPMYSTSFSEWINAKYSDPNPCYSGGAKWLNDPEAENACTRLAGSSQTTLDSCVRTNQALLHQNFVSLDTERVQCPPGLYQWTGLRRNDDMYFPYPSVSLPLRSHCQGDRSQGHYCMTTMQDCCKPSCSWLRKGDPDPEFPYTRFCYANESFFP